MNTKHKIQDTKYQKGFTLFELLIYIAIFAGLSVGIVSVLVSTLRTQPIVEAKNEVLQNSRLVMESINQKIGRAVSVDAAQPGLLKLVMPAESENPTVFTLSNGTLFIKEGNSATTTLTTDKVNVDSLVFGQVFQPPAPRSLSVQLSMSYRSAGNPVLTFSQTLQQLFPVAKAVTFDSDVLPASNDVYNIGAASPRWKNGYFSGQIQADGTGNNYFMGNVGMGITNPGMPLQVYKNITNPWNGSTGQLDVSLGQNCGSGGGGTCLVLYRSADSNGQTGIASIKSGAGSWGDLLLNPYGGNVGIGTTTPGKLLQLYGTGASELRVEGGTRGQITLRDYGAGTDQKNYRLWSDGGVFGIETLNDAEASTTRRLTVDAAGNVGIGTDAPDLKLSAIGHVSSAGEVTDAFSVRQNILLNGGFEGTYTGGLAPSWSEYDSGANGTPSQATTTVHSGSSSQKYVALTSGIGIYQQIGGLNASKTYQYSVWVYVTAGSVVVKGWSETQTQTVSTLNQWVNVTMSKVAGAASVYWHMYSGAASSTFYVDDVTLTLLDSGTNLANSRFYISPDGNVGIGTTAPSSKLEVQQVSGAILMSAFSGIQAANTHGHWLAFNGGVAGATTRGYLGFTHTGSSGGTLWATEVADYMAVAGASGLHLGNTNQAAPEMTITGGNVGIGTTSPGSKLEVSASNVGVTINGNPGDEASITFKQNGGSTNHAGIGSFTAGSANVGLSLWSGNSGVRDPKLYIRNDGNVGIGTTSPTYKLQIEGSDGFTGLKMYDSNLNKFFILQHHTGVDDDPIVWHSENPSQFWVNGTPILALKGGNVGIGTTTPASKLEVNGNILIDGSNSLYIASWPSAGTNTNICLSPTGYIGTCGSDASFKENIRYIDYSVLDAIKRLKPAIFDYINGDKNVAGFIAQDVQAVLPDTVKMNPTDGKLIFTREELVPYTVKAIQEQQEQIESLKNEIRDLRARLNIQ